MSIIERVNVKIQKLKQRINELKCETVSKHQVIQTLNHQLIMLNSCSVPGTSDHMTYVRALIDEVTDKVQKLKKKIAKKEALLSDLEEYLTLYHKQLEVNSCKSNDFKDKLTCMCLDSKILDRMKELELKIDKPKLFKPDEVVPVPFVEDEWKTEAGVVLGYKGARINDEDTGQGSMWLRDKSGKKYELIVAHKYAIFSALSAEHAVEYLSDYHGWDLPNLEELDQLCLDYLNGNRFQSRITPIISVYRSSTKIRTGSEPIESIPLNIDGSYCVDFYSGSIDQKDDGIECLIRPVRRVYS